MKTESRATPEADGAGGEIDVIGVLGRARDSSARPCSRGRLPAARALCLPSRYWMAWKIGLACGFTATPILRPQDVQIERGHDRRERCARSLMTANLQTVRRSRAGGWRCGSSSSQAKGSCARVRRKNLQIIGLCWRALGHRRLAFASTISACRWPGWTSGPALRGRFWQAGGRSASITGFGGFDGGAGLAICGRRTLSENQ